MKPKVSIYCDGACLGNPGSGGWAALLMASSSGKMHEKLLIGAEKDSTNNRMELRAAIEGLVALKKSSQVSLYSDSKYVVTGMKQWIFAWRNKNFKTANNKLVKNQVLWLELDKAAQKHDVSWHWVKGHSGHPQNERVDEAARNAAEQLVRN